MKTYKVSMTPKYKGSYANNRVIVEGVKQNFTIGAIKRGEEGRQEFGGPMVAGPWAYAAPNCTVIDNHGGTGAEIAKQRKAGVLVECKLTDKLIINGDTYSIAKANAGRDDYNIKLTLVKKAKETL